LGGVEGDGRKIPSAPAIGRLANGVDAAGQIPRCQEAEERANQPGGQGQRDDAVGDHDQDRPQRLRVQAGQGQGNNQRAQKAIVVVQQGKEVDQVVVGAGETELA
jgi:hypothetical protein